MTVKMTTRRSVLGGLIGGVVATPVFAADVASVRPANTSGYKSISSGEADPFGATGSKVMDRPGPWGLSSRRFANELCEAVFNRVNEERRGKGLAELTPSAPLAKVAGAYSAEMIEGDFFGHFSPDGRKLGDRLKNFGVDAFTEVAENLWNAEGRVNWYVEDNTRRAVDDWLASKKGHREAMLDANLRVAGVGSALHEQRVVVAMLFGRA